jgi:hypothetical protein
MNDWMKKLSLAASVVAAALTLSATFARAQGFTSFKEVVPRLRCQTRFSPISRL